MKNIFYLLFTILSTHFSVTSQNVVMPKFSQSINLSASIGGQFYYKEFGDGFPGLSIGYEYAAADNFTVKVQAGFNNALTPNYEIVDDTYQIEYNYYCLSIGGNYYFFESSDNNLLGYGGVNLFHYRGEGTFNSDSDFEDFQKPKYPSESETIFCPLIGVKYFLNNRFSVLGEFAYNSFYSTFGIEYNL